MSVNIRSLFIGQVPHNPRCEEHAATIFTVLDALERGEQSPDWIEQLVSTGLGMVCEKGDLARSLGEVGCRLSWNACIELKPAFHRLKKALKERKGRRFPIPHPDISKRNFASNWNPNVTDCLTSAGKIAFVHGRDKAARRCFEEVIAQGENPSAIPAKTTWFDSKNPLQSHTLAFLSGVIFPSDLEAKDHVEQHQLKVGQTR